MTDSKLVKLEKEIEDKIKIPQQKKRDSKFVVDVDKLKKTCKTTERVRK